MNIVECDQIINFYKKRKELICEKKYGEMFEKHNRWMDTYLGKPLPEFHMQFFSVGECIELIFDKRENLNNIKFKVEGFRIFENPVNQKITNLEFWGKDLEKPSSRTLYMDFYENGLLRIHLYEWRGNKIYVKSIKNLDYTKE